MHYKRLILTHIKLLFDCNLVLAIIGRKATKVDSVWFILMTDVQVALIKKNLIFLFYALSKGSTSVVLMRHNLRVRLGLHEATSQKTYRLAKT